MKKIYTMGAELKTLGVLPVSKRTSATRYGKYDSPVALKKSNNYVYDGSVLPKKQQKAYDEYHASKGKKK
jgi:hypothetical protein